MTDLFPNATGMVGGPAQCVGGLRPVTGREPGIGDPLFDNAGDLRMLLQEGFIGRGRFRVAAQTGQRLGAQEYGGGRDVGLSTSREPACGEICSNTVKADTGCSSARKESAS